jgi:hypothetical protein
MAGEFNFGSNRSSGMKKVAMCFPETLATTTRLHGVTVRLNKSQIDLHQSHQKGTLYEILLRGMKYRPYCDLKLFSKRSIFNEV